MSYVNLHTHTHFSILDGLNTPLEYAQVAKSLGMKSLAITDHGTISGHRDFQIACAGEGIKPILGIEMYFSPTGRDDRRPVTAREDNTSLYEHLIVLAKNQNGLKNLSTISREAWTSGYYYRPRADMELLKEYGDDLIVLSGCMSGPVLKAYRRGDEEGAIKIAKSLYKIFGDDFYFEVQTHNEDGLNDFLFDLSKKSGIKCVATCDSHFTRPELRWIEEAALILSTSPKRNRDVSYDDIKHLADPFEKFNALYKDRPISFENVDTFLMSHEEMSAAWKARGVNREDILDVTLEIDEKIGSYDFTKNQDFLPLTTASPITELRTTALKGLKDRGLYKKEYIDRIEEELQVIFDKNFASYFLVIQDMVKYAKDHNIPVGPGRGSGAGSLLNYCLGITDVDPIKYGLLFSRFLDKDREDAPDIDTDISRSRRAEVKEYLAKKYGHVASISNFIYFSGKGVVRDASRVYAVPLQDVNKALDKVDGWDDFISSHMPDVKHFREKYPEVITLADKLRGRIRSVGIHAGGIITSKYPIEEYAPIETRDDPSNKVSGRVPVVAWDMEQCASAGFIKLDVLGLGTLDVINDAIEMIESRHNVKIDWSKIGYDDKDVFEGFTNGDVTGVFQADGPAYKELIAEMGIDDFNDLVVSTALARPGARETVGESFIKRKKGLEPIQSIHPIMDKFLGDTYGLLTFQEQIMHLATELAGMTGGEANALRKIIGKKKDVKEFEQYKNKFIEGASKHIEKKVAEKLWDDIEHHAKYSFAKSHAVAYSMLTFQCMWLKTHYPLEFLTSLFIHEGKKEKRIDIVLNMWQHKIDVLPPHVNESDQYMKIVSRPGAKPTVRLGLTDIKYISDLVYLKLNKHRPFTSMAEVMSISKTKGSGVSSRTVDSLDKVGALLFEDNPLRGDEEDYFYEYLNIPRFKPIDLPDYITLDKAKNYNERDVFILKAMVTNHKKGKTNGREWCRIEMVDETGKITAFVDPMIIPESGKMYVFLLAGGQVMEAVEVESFTFDNPIPFVQYVYENVPEPEKGEVHILAVEKRITKNKQMMGTFIAANRFRDLKKVIVFPQAYAKFARKLKAGSNIKISVNKTQGGDLALEEVKR